MKFRGKEFVTVFSIYRPVRLLWVSLSPLSGKPLVISLFIVYILTSSLTFIPLSPICLRICPSMYPFYSSFDLLTLYLLTYRPTKLSIHVPAIQTQPNYMSIKLLYTYLLTFLPLSPIYVHICPSLYPFHPLVNLFSLSTYLQTYKLSFHVPSI